MVLLYQLQAAEARIKEANPGFSVEREQKGSMEVPLQEIFSERQKYGRVARYELRPGHHSQTTTSAFQLGEHKRNPRQAPDFPVVGRIIAFVNFPMRVLLCFFMAVPSQFSALERIFLRNEEKFTGHKSFQIFVLVRY